MEYILAIWLYFAGLGGSTGFLPLGSPLAPPGPEGPAQVQRVNGLPVSSCPDYSLRVLPPIDERRAGDVMLLGWTGLPGGRMAWVGFDGRFHVRQSLLEVCSVEVPYAP